MTTKIPVELSSTPGIVDGSNATAITISSAEKVTFAKDIEIQGDSVSGSEGGHITLRAASGGSKEFGIDVDSNNNLRFITEDDGTGDNGAAHVYLTNTGNVGIGTSSPARSPLHLATSGTNYCQLHMTNGTSGSTSSDGLTLFTNGTDAGLMQRENSYLLFGTNDTERMRILAGGGLTFNGDTAAANALDDYEEGTWNPADGSGAGLTPSFTNNRYTKVGRLVVASVRLTFPTTSNTSLAQYTLPFTADSNVNASAVGGVCTEQDLNSNLVVTASINDTTKVLFRTNGVTALTNAQLSGKILRFTVTYHAA